MQTIVSNLDTLVLGLLGGMLINAIPDYVSLLETRWILGRAEATGRLVRALAIDFATWGSASSMRLGRSNSFCGRDG